MHTHFIDHDGGRIAFDDTLDTEADRQAVVLIPGMLDTRATYRHLRPLLTESGRRVISFDPRGYGETSPSWADFSQAAQATDIVALIEHLHAGPVILARSTARSGVPG